MGKDGTVQVRITIDVYHAVTDEARDAELKAAGFGFEFTAPLIVQRKQSQFTLAISESDLGGIPMELQVDIAKRLTTELESLSKELS